MIPARHTNAHLEQPPTFPAARRPPSYAYTVAEMSRPLELGTATFPRIVAAPESPTIVPPDEDIEPVGAWIGWPGEGWWCE